MVPEPDYREERGFLDGFRAGYTDCKKRELENNVAKDPFGLNETLDKLEAAFKRSVEAMEKSAEERDAAVSRERMRCYRIAQSYKDCLNEPERVAYMIMRDIDMGTDGNTKTP